MKLETLKDLYLEELKDIYDAENQILKALPKMAKAATNEDLRDAFQEHEEITKGQVDRLDQIFDRLGTRAKGRKCKAMEGLVEESKELLSEDSADDVRDAGLIASAQRVEHYEMAVYGTLRTYAEQLGFDEDAELLQETLDEEEEADEKLTDLALECVNTAASEGESEEDEEPQAKRSSERPGGTRSSSRRG